MKKKFRPLTFIRDDKHIKRVKMTKFGFEDWFKKLGKIWFGGI